MCAGCSLSLPWVRGLTLPTCRWYSLDAVRPSLELLQLVKPCLERPVWLNADVLPGPNGINAVVDAEGFLEIVTSFFPDVTLSLGWTTGWHPEQHNEGKERLQCLRCVACFPQFVIDSR